MDHSTCTPPLLASKDIFRRHLKKTDIHLPCLAASLICKVPLYSRFISGTDKLMITPLGVLQQHITGNTFDATAPADRPGSPPEQVVGPARDNKIQSLLLALDRGLIQTPAESNTRAYSCNLNTTLMA